jgi:CHAT domain-containing protein
VHLNLGFDATRTSLLALDDPRAWILHISAHTLVNDTSKAASGILLSLYDAGGRQQEGFASYYDLLQIPRTPPLAVLSTCGAGGGADVSGEGPIGLSRAFMYAGSSKVVANLWDAGDQSSLQLMSAFYQALVRDGLSPAAALQSAQLHLRNEGRRFRRPYAWAGWTVAYRAPAPERTVPDPQVAQHVSQVLD